MSERKRKNRQDATLVNIRALKRRVATLEGKVRHLNEGMTEIVPALVGMAVDASRRLKRRGR